MMTLPHNDRLFDHDLILLTSGSILSVYGNYAGETCRARPTYLADTLGDRTIDGLRYHKVVRDQLGSLPGCICVFDFPGEQHYLVPRSAIAKVFRPYDGFASLNENERLFADSLIQMMATYCGILPDRHGLAGSSALACRHATSDWDWIIYDHLRVYELESLFASHPLFLPTLTYQLSAVVTKYRTVSGLSEQEISAFVLRKRRYFAHAAASLSFTFVDIASTSDADMEACSKGARARLGCTMTGRVLDGRDADRMPRAVRLYDSDMPECHLLMSWLPLYAGALQTADLVEARGDLILWNDRAFLLCDGPENYIRILEKYS